jgi:ferric-dicitrate binding protein FerR (iron transport regulator)
MLAKKLQLSVAAYRVFNIPPRVSIHKCSRRLFELQSRAAFEATREALQHWLEFDRAWQFIEVMNGELKDLSSPSDLAIAHNNSAVRKISRPHRAGIRDEFQPAHGQRKAS